MAGFLIMLKILSAGIGVFFSWFFGSVDMMIYVLVVLIVVDYISDVMKGVITKQLSSAAGTQAIFQKILIILLVGVSNIIDIYLIRSENAPLRTAVTFFYIANQGLSLIENAAIIGLPVPESLKESLLKLQKGKKDA
ncbi:MAG: phage holin family protein [Turicibacter sp.]|nr:phage holin family protein [Turicibacter sp.]